MSVPDDAVPIQGWDGAYISRDGRVWRNGKEKSVYVGAVGYKVVSFSRGNKSTPLYLHRLLALHFIGQPPTDRHEVCHINGDRTDNRIENLRWGTRKENVADAIRHGTATTGHRNAMAKLTKNDVLFARDMRLMGFNCADIARVFRVSKETAQRVSSRTTYKDC